MSRGSISHCAIIFAVVMVSACQLDFGDFSQFPNDDSDIVGPEADIDFDFGEVEMADEDVSDSSEPSSEIPDLDVVEEDKDDKIDDATEEMAEEDIEETISCERNADCPVGWVCGTGAVCWPRCEEGGCQSGASCNPNNGLCEFCSTHCPARQCCNINAPDNSPEFWYCGSCCSSPCPEGTACMGGDHCVELVCPEECDEAEYCAPETGYVCARDSSYAENPAICDTYLSVEGELSITSVRDLALRFGKLTEIIVGKGEGGGQHIAALRSGQLVVFSMVDRDVTEIEPFGHSELFQDLHSFHVDSNGIFHLIATMTTNENMRGNSLVYMTTASGEWEIEVLSSSFYDSYFVSELVVDETSKIHLVWGSSHNLRYSTNRSGTFIDHPIENMACTLPPTLFIAETGQPQMVCFREIYHGAFVAELGEEGWISEAWEPIPDAEESEPVVLAGSATRDASGALHAIVLSTEELFGDPLPYAEYWVRDSSGWTHERITVGDNLIGHPVITVENNGEVRVGGVGADGLLRFFVRRQGRWSYDQQSDSRAYPGEVQNLYMMRGGKWVAGYLQNPGPLTFVSKDGPSETSFFLDSSDVVKTSDWVVALDGRPSFVIAVNEWTQSGWRNSLQLATVVSNERFEYTPIVSSINSNQVQFTQMKLHVNAEGKFSVVYQRDDDKPSFQYSEGREDEWITRPLPIPEQNEDASFVLKDMDFADDGCLHFVFLRDREPYELVYNSMCDLAFVSETVVNLDTDDPPEAWIRVDPEGEPVIVFSNRKYTVLAKKEGDSWELEELVRLHYKTEGFGFDMSSNGDGYSWFYHENYFCTRWGCELNSVGDVLKIIRTSGAECLRLGNRTQNVTTDLENHFHLFSEGIYQSEFWKRYCTDRFGSIRCSDANPIHYVLNADNVAVSGDGRVHILYSDGTRYVSFLPIPIPEQPESTEAWYR